MPVRVLRIGGSDHDAGLVTQIRDLWMLALDVQEQVLALKAFDVAEPIAERALRAVARGTWAEQRAAWTKLSATSEAPGHQSM